jgi:hypothetical protein
MQRTCCGLRPVCIPKITSASKRHMCWGLPALNFGMWVVYWSCGIAFALC